MSKFKAFLNSLKFLLQLRKLVLSANIMASDIALVLKGKPLIYIHTIKSVAPIPTLEECHVSKSPTSKDTFVQNEILIAPFASC